MSTPTTARGALLRRAGTLLVAAALVSAPAASALADPTTGLSTDAVPTASSSASPTPSASPSAEASPTTSPTDTPSPSPTDPAPSPSVTPSELPTQSPTTAPAPTTPPRETATSTARVAGASAARLASAAGAAVSQAAYAAAFIARTLATGDDHYVYPGGYPDVGNSIDAVLALDAAEAGSTQADATFGWIEDNVADYMGYSYDSTFAGPTAKAIIGAVAHGGDPTAFGGVDLIAELKATEGAVEPGRFSDLPVDCGADVCDYSTTVSQSLGVIALVRAGESPSIASVDFLLEQQCSDGGFRSNMDADGCASDTDATAFASQALIALGSGATTPNDQALAVDPQTASVDALDWLAAAQFANGGFASDNDGANTNSTAVSAQAFAAGGRDAELADAQTFIATLQYGCSSPAVLRGGIAFSVAKRSTTKIADEDTRATPQSALALSGGSLLSVQRSEGASASTVALPCTATPTAEPTTEPTGSDEPTVGSEGGSDPSTTVGSSATGSLAQTGTDLLAPALLGLLLVVIGGVAVFASTRRRGAHA
jgi:hypothetical protein